ncbi:MAG: hypothetical protein LBI15_00110 [Dysgonamonadaceae bacterium]|nr:hypothetical protein [Dysgonamonadaceae bacterium]
MKKTNLFLFSLVTLVTLSVGFSSCGGSNNSTPAWIGTWSYSGEKFFSNGNSGDMLREIIVTNASGLTPGFNARVIMNDGGFSDRHATVKRIDPGVNNVDYTGDIVRALDLGNSTRIIIDSSNSSRASLERDLPFRGGWTKVGTLTRK